MDSAAGKRARDCQGLRGELLLACAVPQEVTNNETIRMQTSAKARSRYFRTGG